MLTIVCGEDTIKARNYLSEQTGAFSSKGHRIETVSPAELYERIRSDQSISLFGEPIIYSTSGLVSYLARRSKKKTEELNHLHTNTAITVLDWESGKSSYELGLKKIPYVKEFKPDSSIFTLQEQFVPQAKDRFLTTLSRLVMTQPEQLIYTLLIRHVRLLVWATYSPATCTAAPWQKTKIMAQSQKWQPEKLLASYEALCRIDETIKTNSTPYTIHRSIEIVACYYL